MHYPLELSKCRRVPLNRRLDIAQRPNRNQRNLPRMLPNLPQQKLHPIGVLPLRGLQCISGLASNVAARRRNPGRHRNIAPSHRAQVPVHQPRPQLRIAVSRSNPQQPQLRTMQRQRQRKSIVNVIAYIGIENRQLRCSRNGCPAGADCPTIRTTINPSAANATNNRRIFISTL